MIFFIFNFFSEFWPDKVNQFNFYCILLQDTNCFLFLFFDIQILWCLISFLYSHASRQQVAIHEYCKEAFLWFWFKLYKYYKETSQLSKGSLFFLSYWQVENLLIQFRGTLLRWTKTTITTPTVDHNHVFTNTS